MTQIVISGKGFYLAMMFDPNNPDDQEIMAEAFLLIHRRGRVKANQQPAGQDKCE